MTPMTVEPSDIRDARDRIAPHVRVTPVLQPGSGAFGLDGSVTLKLELLQHTGSFKPRGAFNKMLASDVGPAGVIAASGGTSGWPSPTRPGLWGIGPRSSYRIRRPRPRSTGSASRAPTST